MKLFARRPRHTKKLRRLPAYHVAETLLSMPVASAQHTNVVTIRDFISECERKSLLVYMSQCELPAYTNNAAEDIGESGYPIHTTTYLQTFNTFEIELHWLYLRIRNLARDISIQQGWGFDVGECSSFNVRVAEYHEMYKQGGLRDPKHYDCGSLITIDIMMQEADEGAVFQTLECIDGKEELRQHAFQNGDALVFVSHKYHCVSPLTAGVRKVLVVEFWNGKKRCCGHRCDVPFEICSFVDA